MGCYVETSYTLCQSSVQCIHYSGYVTLRHVTYWVTVVSTLRINVCICFAHCMLYTFAIATDTLPGLRKELWTPWYPGDEIEAQSIQYIHIYPQWPALDKIATHKNVSINETLHE